MRSVLRGLLSASLALASLVAASSARADRVEGTRSEKLVEQAHWIGLHVDRGHVELVVRRTVFNGGPRHDQALLWLDVPEDSVAVDLRTLSMKDGRPIWYRAELMEAEAAAAKYRELTGVGGYYPKDPALLSWRRAGYLALQVFPVPPSQPKTVEYTLEMPAHYREGRWHVKLPKIGTEKMPAQAEITPVNEGDRVFVDGRSAPPGTGIALSKDEIDVALARRSPVTLDGALASVPFGPGRVLSHLHVESAARLSAAPRGAHVVVVIDGSRSFGEHERRTGIAAVRAMLGHLPDARVEVLTFDREVKPRLGGFVPVARAADALAKLAVEPRNGSRVDDALSRADALLAKLPAHVAKRIVLVTDLRTRSELTPARVKPLLTSGALLHVGVMKWGEPSLERDDTNPWAEVTRPTGGLVWNAAASFEADDAAKMTHVYEEWARPTRLHHFAVKARGIEEGALDVPAELPEGEGFEDLRVGNVDVGDLSVEGELWTTPVRLSRKPDDAEGRLWSALAFGAPEILGQLSEPEMMVLAKHGHAVSPVTSLLAIEPGVRPSTEGLEEVSGIGEGGGGVASCIGLGSIGRAGGGAFDRDDFLKRELSRSLAACGGAGRKATVVLETTLAEVVDVPRASVEGPPDASIDRCLREAAWELDLPGRFDDEWKTYTVSL